MDPIFEVSESVALLEQAVESNQHQIHEVSESTSRQISELATNTNRQMREVMTGIERQGTEFRTELRGLATEFAASRKTNWPLFLSIVMAAFIFLGAAWSLMELRTQATVAPITTMMQMIQQQNQEARGEISSLRATTQYNRSAIDVLNNTQSEVETQMDAMAQESNTQFAAQQRKNAELQNALHMSGVKMPPYPDGPWFFPNISNRHGSNPSKAQEAQ